MLKTKNFLRVILFFFFLFNINLIAQENSAEDSRTNQLQFYLINGLDVSYSDLSSSLPLRYNLSISGNYNNDDSEGKDRQFSNDTTLNKQDASTKSFNYRISATLHYLVTLYKNNPVSIYLGVGPIFSYSRHYSNYNSSYEGDHFTEPNKYQRDNWSNGYEIGLSSVIGLEAEMTESIALFAEYDLDFLYSWSDSKSFRSGNTSSSKHNGEGDSYRASLSGVKLGVSIYF